MNWEAACIWLQNWQNKITVVLILFILYCFRIMVLDEIDQLDSKNQEILYTIFEWPSLPKSRLILVGKSSLFFA